LTVARFEQAARLRQQATQETLASSGIGADFDFIAGCDTGGAVLSVARWRRCSLVLLEQHASAQWWRWSGGMAAEWLVDVAESLSFLALPGKAIVHSSSKFENNARVLQRQS
jgi:hypothetical protein